MQNTDVIIIGAGAAGLMCAIEAGRRGRSVMVLDHANKAGKKILVSGGGRCNFTNYTVGSENYISHNPHFCKSALSRYTQWDFIELVKRHRIEFHERLHGRLFCTNSARDILSMLLAQCERAGVVIHLHTKIDTIRHNSESSFEIKSNMGTLHCQSLVVASGGLSFPTMGASPFGYQVASQFGIHAWPTSAGLVPFTLQPDDKVRFSPLTGISVDSIVSSNKQRFHENILFTHRGLSGPVILQISSYWRPGDQVNIDLLPDISLLDSLNLIKESHPKQKLSTALTKFLPKRLVAALMDTTLADKCLYLISNSELEAIASRYHQWTIQPNGTEGYRTAEVTLGGVDCNALSSKTMESNAVSGLYFIGEVVDVTGWLGGYNFQWAWSSGWCAGQYV